MADNKDNWRKRPNSTVRPISESDMDEMNKDKEVVGANTADLKKAVTGLISPAAKKEDASYSMGDDAYKRPSANMDVDEVTYDDKDKEYMDYLNNTSAENERELKELNERRETKRLERESAVITVKTPTRSGTFPEGRDRTTDKYDKRPNRPVEETRPTRVAVERETAGRYERHDRTNDEPQQRRPRERTAERSRKDEYGASDALRWPEIRFVVFAGAFVFLLVLVILVLLLINTNRNLSSARADYAAASAANANNNNADAELQEQLANALVSMESLQALLAERDAEIEDLNIQLDAAHMPGQQGGTTTGNDTLPPPPGIRTHRVTNEPSLWQVAVVTLGDGNRYRDIMDANGMTSPSISYGDVLIIPN